MPHTEPPPSRSVRAGVLQALAPLKEVTGVPLVFSGTVLPDPSGVGRRLVLTDFVGEHRGALRNVEVAPCTGLGGRVAGSGRAQVVQDYGSSRTISHEYDGQVVAAEGIRSVCAFPVIVHGSAVAVVYLAARTGVLGDQALHRTALATRRLGRRIEAEVSAGGGKDGRVDSLAEAVSTIDGVIRDLRPESAAAARLAGVRRYLAADLAGLPDGEVVLSARQIDVLRLVARGWTNKRVADELGLREQTVKSYLNAGMRKLGVRNRTSAVRVARSAGLL